MSPRSFLFLTAIAIAGSPARAGTAASMAEPGSLSLLALGAAGLFVGRRLSRR